MEIIKDFFVGLATIVAFLWCLYALAYGFVTLFSLGEATFRVMPIWATVLASIPWAALVLAMIALLGEAIREGN